MILENIAKSAVRYGLRQDCTLENQPGRQQFIPTFNPVAAGVLLSELSLRNSEQHIAPTALELSVLLSFIGATSDGDDITINQSGLFDLLRTTLAV